MVTMLMLINTNLYRIVQSLFAYLQVISQPADRLDPHVGANIRKFLSQKTDVYLHVIFHRIRVISPYLGEDRFLGNVISLRPEKKPHDLKLSGGKPNTLRSTDQCGAG